jgi:hypothetical protein
VECIAHPSAHPKYWLPVPVGFSERDLTGSHLGTVPLLSPHHHLPASRTFHHNHHHHKLHLNEIMSYTLRIRTQLGTWRVNNVSPSAKLAEVRSRVESEHKTDLLGKPFTADITGKAPLADSRSISELGLKHGDMIYAVVDEEKTAIHEQAVTGKRITKDGLIVPQEFSDVSHRNGFRPGMRPLRSMKMAWTLNEFIELDNQFTYDVKHQPTTTCIQAKINSAAIQEFQGYMLRYDYKVLRYGVSLWRNYTRLTLAILARSSMSSWVHKGWDTCTGPLAATSL